MSRTAARELTPRHLAMLRAVNAGRAELTGDPDLYVDGLCCCDHQATRDLIAAGLITTAAPLARVGHRVTACLTDAGRAQLDTPTATPVLEVA